MKKFVIAMIISLNLFVCVNTIDAYTINLTWEKNLATSHGYLISWTTGMPNYLKNQEKTIKENSIKKIDIGFTDHHSLKVNDWILFNGIFISISSYKYGPNVRIFNESSTSAIMWVAIIPLSIQDSLITPYLRISSHFFTQRETVMTNYYTHTYIYNNLEIFFLWQVSKQLFPIKIPLNFSK